MKGKQRDVVLHLGGITVIEVEHDEFGLAAIDAGMGPKVLAMERPVLGAIPPALPSA